MELLLWMVLAHLVGDFLLQPHSWRESIESRKAKSIRLYIHFVLFVAVSLLLIPPWTAALLFAAGHIFIRLTVLYVPATSRQQFLVDQTLHVLVVVLLALVLADVDARVILNLVEQNLALITGFLFLTKPSSVVIRHIISRWNPDPDGDSPDSLEKAGTWIGILERLFVFVFVLGGHYSAVGFLLAAKSVFRFGDLREAHDRKLTEYILIGTLLSVGIALVTAFAVQIL